MNENETPMRLPGYQGRVTIVTAAGSGIGLAIVDQLLANGAIVVANDLEVGALGVLTTDVRYGGSAGP